LVAICEVELAKESLPFRVGCHPETILLPAVNVDIEWRKVIGMAAEDSAIDQAVIDARLNEVVARFGPMLTGEQRELVRTRIERTLQLAAAMRTLALGNADEPEIGFAPYRSDV
jgi:hypothetical protein